MARKQHSPEEKSRLVLEALRGERTLYYRAVPPSAEDLYMKQLIDKIYTRYPMYGYRRICWYLNNKEKYPINHKAVLRHMQEMGIPFVLETSQRALRIFVPEIMNSDQGSHFTSPKYTRLFLETGSKISMDHRERAYGNERWIFLKESNLILKKFVLTKGFTLDCRRSS